MGDFPSYIKMWAITKTWNAILDFKCCLNTETSANNESFNIENNLLVSLMHTILLKLCGFRFRGREKDKRGWSIIDDNQDVLQCIDVVNIFIKPKALTICSLMLTIQGNKSW